MKRKRVKVEIGSGNVFKDVGLPNPEQILLIADLDSLIAKHEEIARLPGAPESHQIRIRSLKKLRNEFKRENQD